MVRGVVWIVGALTVASGTAHALKPGKHAAVAVASCEAAGLPDALCARIATEDYNTDAREWEDLRAHAQIDAGETSCTAADRAAERLRQLGHDLRDALERARSASDADVGAVGSLVGRALHTVQDNCAHHGMPNPQHAWLSLADFCEGTATSPDLQQAAITCAQTESDAFLRLVASAVSEANLASILDEHSCPANPNDRNDPPSTLCSRRTLPGPLDACGFFAQAKDWDGTDRRWNNEIATPALREAFAAGLSGATTVSSICEGDERVLSAAVSKPIVEVSAGPRSCLAATLFCLGKADADENPFADDPATTPTEAGCTSTRADSSSWLIGLGLLVLIARRRARAA